MAAPQAQPLPQGRSEKVLTSPELVQKAKVAAGLFKRPAYWMLFFGWGLAICAGIINTTAFRQWKTFVSHVTGTTTNIAMRTEEMHQIQSEFSNVGANFLLVASFILGAYYSGMLIDKNAVQLNGKAMYGLALVTESVLLMLAVCTSPTLFAMCAASAACGLQNAMCTSHFGVVVRTTHVTGTATDIGSALGRTLMLYLRNGFNSAQFNVVEQAEVEIEMKRLIVLVPMWSCFLIGSIAGAYLESSLGIYALLVPAMVTCVVGMLYINFRQHLKQYLKALHQEQMEELKQKVDRAVHVLVAAEAERAAPEAARKVTDEQHEAALHNMEQAVHQVLDAFQEMEAHQASGEDPLSPKADAAPLPPPPPSFGAGPFQPQAYHPDAAAPPAISLPVPFEPRQPHPPACKPQGLVVGPAAEPEEPAARSSRPGALVRRDFAEGDRQW